MNEIIENWKPVVGYEDFYEVSDLGRVRALFVAARGRWKPGRIIKPKINADKYHRINLYDSVGNSETKTVHSIVLEAFSGNRPSGFVSRHLNGNPSNNAASNLVWGTQKENHSDSVLHGTDVFGERSKQSKLTDQKVIQLRAERMAGSTIESLSKKYGISQIVAWKVATNKSWRHVAQITI